MTMAAVTNTLVYPPVPGEDRLKRGNGTFAVRRCSPHRIAVGVRGDVDAANGRDLARYAAHHTRAARQLVLDLRSVDFFGTQGFTALYYISVHCARTDVDWVIVGSRQVRRLLSICDPDGELPLADNLRSALSRLDRIAHGRYHTPWSAQRREKLTAGAGHGRAS